MSEYCCDVFAEKVKDGTIEVDGSRRLHVNGCCGGGCYVMVDLRFCPFCGHDFQEVKP